MLLPRTLLLILITLGLSACTTKHGHEGEYVLEPSSGIEAMDDMLALLSTWANAGEPALFVIGSNYLDINGSRTEYDKIFVRQSGSQQYLVFVQGNDETLWKIHNNGERLSQHAGLVQLSLRRVNRL